MEFTQPFHPLLWMPIIFFILFIGWAVWQRRRMKKRLEQQHRAKAGSEEVSPRGR